MNTYREVGYMCLDLIKALSDDSYYTLDHIMYLMDKFRALLLKKYYSSIKKEIPESNYQSIELTLIPSAGISGDTCSNSYLVSSTTVPEVMEIAKPRITSVDFIQGEFAYVDKQRIRFVSNNKWLKKMIYAALGHDNKLYLKSANPQFLHLKKVLMSAIFENPQLVAGDDDILDSTFPLEEALIPELIEMVVKEVLGAAYRPKDDLNDAFDNLSDVASFVRRNMKSNLTKQIEGE